MFEDVLGDFGDIVGGEITDPNDPVNHNALNEDEEWDSSSEAWSTKDRLWNNHDSERLWDSKL